MGGAESNSPAYAFIAHHKCKPGFFSDGQLSAAENVLRRFLNLGNHAEAFRLLGRIQHQRGDLAEAEALLETALKLAPNYLAARLDYIRVLLDRQKYPRVYEEMKLEPDNRDYLVCCPVNTFA